MRSPDRVKSVRERIGALLRGSGVDAPFFEADQIVCHILGIERYTIHSHPELEVDSSAWTRMEELAARRAAGEPLAYVLGSALFCGHEFSVDRRVLIPRPETEVLVELALSHLRCLPASEKITFADWCTGSGCIAISLLIACERLSGYAVDSESAAIDCASTNAAKLNVSKRLKFIRSSDPATIRDIAPESLDFITTNPPYIPQATVATLERQVKDYEPITALDGGPDGLDIYPSLLAGCARFLKKDAPLIAETGGPPQIEQLVNLTEELEPGWRLKFERAFPDHLGISRFILWRKL